jgi:hypothetical protein
VTTRVVYNLCIHALCPLTDNTLFCSLCAAGAATELRQAIDLYKRFANSRDDATAHVSDDDKDIVRSHAVKAEVYTHCYCSSYTLA